MKIALCLGALIIFLGYIQLPYLPPPENAPVWMIIALFSISAAPFVPVLVVIMKFLFGLSMGRPLAYGIGALFAVLGLLFTLVSAAFSGAGTALSLWHGLTLTGAVVSSILLFSDKAQFALKSPLFLVFSLAVLVGTWSLSTVPTIAFQAHKIANGRAYCIEPHSSQSGIMTLSGLRGLTFYTNASGFKSTSRWYFHGVLLVEETSDVLEAYNWSPRSMTFNRIDRPSQFIQTPLDVCIPRNGFLTSLAVF